MLAAAVGLEALLSDAKSHKVSSVSWPIALMIGVLALKIHLTKLSSLKHHKSSMLPPPRAIIKTSKLNESARLICLIN